MKITKLAIALLVSAAGAASAQSPVRYVSPGPVVAGSVRTVAMPSKAVKYLNEHFSEVGVKSAEKEYLTGRYDVELLDGLELEFDSKGNLIEVDAPDGYVMTPELISSILPVTAVNLLRSNNYMGFIDKIEKTDNGNWLVEIDNAGDIELKFDSMGEFLSVVD